MNAQLQMQPQSRAHQEPAFAPTPMRSHLLQRKCACGGTPGPTGDCKACKKKRSGLQTKLAVNEPGDIYEQEADRIADQVTAASGHPAVSSALPRIQRLPGQPNGQMDAAPDSVEQALVNPGSPLEPALRGDMEERFGHDFSKVRVHTGEVAEQSARDVNAHAYTVGRNIVFGAGQFTFGTHEGRRLIAHELAHVVQQATSGPGLQRKPKEEDLPSFARATPRDPLPGDPVPGVPKNPPKYTDRDRNNLELALLDRHNKNTQHVKLFVDAYPAALLRIWGGYVAEHVTEEMIKEVEESGWPFWAKLGGFIAREILIAFLFPELEIERLAAKVAYNVAERVGTFSLEEVQAAKEEKTMESGLEKRSHELREEVGGKTKALEAMLHVLPTIVQGLADDTYYTDWVKDARPEDLHLFRIPRAFPELSESQIATLVAQAVAGFLHVKYDVLPWVAYHYEGQPDIRNENSISVFFWLDDREESDKSVTVREGPSFWGPESIGKELHGPLRAMPRIPLYVELRQREVKSEPLYLPSFAESVRPELEARIKIHKAIEDAWPTKSPAQIVRHPGGSIVELWGNLYECFHLYQRIHPDEYFGPLVAKYAKGVEELVVGSPYRTATIAAKELAAHIRPSVQEGAEVFISQSVEPLILNPE
jgi:hypothetical protein